MAKEQLRGASKAGKIAITRWVTKETIAALGRLRGQGSHANPTEGEVIDQAIKLYESYQKAPSTIPAIINDTSGQGHVLAPEDFDRFKGAVASPAEQALAESTAKTKTWAEGKDFNTNPYGCIHCGGTDLAPCAKCFSTGHRGNRLNCFLCVSAND